jgi:predicted nucleotidyltransferase
LQSLLSKTAGLVDVLRNALSALAPRIAVAFVFGSAARGELRTASDIDLLVVGDAAFHEVVNALAPAQDRLAREVNPSVYPMQEFAAKLRAGHHFLTTLLQEPRLFVLGGQDDLDRLGTERLASKPSRDSERDKGSSRPRGPRPSVSLMKKR